MMQASRSSLIAAALSSLATTLGRNAARARTRSWGREGR